jgi:hypothetical protein
LGVGELGGGAGTRTAAAPIGAEVHDGLQDSAECLQEGDELGGRGWISVFTSDVIPIHDVGLGSTRPTDIAAAGNLHSGV